MYSAIDTSNPFDVVNILIDVGKRNNIDIGTEDKDLNSKIHQFLSLDTLQTSHLTLTEYSLATEDLIIQPQEYFKLEHDPMKIGLQLRIMNFDHLKLAYQLYHTYRDPRRRSDELIRAELIMDSIIRQGKLIGRNEPTPSFDIPISKLSLPSHVKVQTLTDLPVIKWQRLEEDRIMFSIVFLKSVFATLKKGWMINPELIRLLNIVDKKVLKEIIHNLTPFVMSRITVSLQRLADIMYLDNFGTIDQEIQANLLDDMFQHPIEDRGNLPQSEAEEVVNFLNILRRTYPEFDKFTKLSRKIAVLTKPIKEESTEFRGFDTTSDAIREILSVIHYSMNNQKLESQIQMIHTTVTDPDFHDISRYYFDPSFELLHTPFLTSIQATKERMKLLLQHSSSSSLSNADLASLEKSQSVLFEYLESRDSSKELIEIWKKLNSFLEPQVDISISQRAKADSLEMIKGKEIIINIMTPLLLAKYEGRGYNPLAANINEEFASRLKSITGIIAIGSNFKHNELKNLLNTMFEEAPELKSKLSNDSHSHSGPPMPSLPKPDLPKPKSSSSSVEGSHLIPTKMGISLARIANEYVTGGGERNLHKALVDLIAFTKRMND